MTDTGAPYYLPCEPDPSMLELRIGWITGGILLGFLTGLLAGWLARHSMGGPRPSPPDHGGPGDSHAESIAQPPPP